MPRGQLRRSLRQLMADSQRAAKLRANGLPYREIANELGISRNTAARLVWWHEDMLAAWGGFPRNRARRLPFRHGRAWDQQRFDHLVADRAKVLETMKAQETLDKADRIQRVAASATRDAEKARVDEACEWVKAGSPPDKAPAWLKKVLEESLPRGSFTVCLDVPPPFGEHVPHELPERCLLLAGRAIRLPEVLDPPLDILVWDADAQRRVIVAVSHPLP